MVGVSKNDIVVVDLKDAIGSEQGKERYAIVVQNEKGNFYSNTTIIIPFTHVLKSAHLPTHLIVEKTKENGLKVNSMLLAEQIRVVSKLRIKCKVGHISDKNVLNQIKRAREANFEE